MPLQVDKLFINIAQLATPVRLEAHRGREMARVQVVPNAAIAVQAGKIVWAGARQDWQGQARETIDLEGRAVVPGLIDPHTHAVWAGDRLDDFEARAQGASYEQILAQGGGIYHTIRHTAQATPEELVALACPRLLQLMRSGATTLEVKSGYGLTPEAEMKILHAIAQLPAALTRQLLRPSGRGEETSPLVSISSGRGEVSSPLVSISSGGDEGTAPLLGISSSGGGEVSSPLLSISSGGGEETASLLSISSGGGEETSPLLSISSGGGEETSPLPIDIIPTLLIHVPPREGRVEYLHEVCHELIPEVARRGLARAVDIFIEREAFNVQEAEQVLRTAQAYGLGIKAHADQFHAMGGVDLAVRLGALSVDHLEASGEAQIHALASSSTIATILPGVSLNLGLPPAPARALIEAGAAVALGTDLNPGSSPLFSMQLALALAVRLNRLTPAEALVAGTVNAAAALGLTDRGALVPGARADFLVLASSDWRDLLYALGGQIVDAVYLAGERVI